MLIELLGGPVDGLVLDAIAGNAPRQFILPAACLGIGFVYVSEQDSENDFVQYRFSGFCSLVNVATANKVYCERSPQKVGG